jgi:pimeloyl-ACP methyl ester carboxylesterase
MAEPLDVGASRRHRRARRPVWNYLVGLGATIAVIVVALVVFLVVRHHTATKATDKAQAALAPFYTAPPGWQTTAPGAVLRTERVTGVPSGGDGWRILYRTQKSDGSPAYSSGLVFAPGSSAPAAPPGGRIVVAWAHPTTGLSDVCAPSRTPNVESDVQGLASFLQAGWVVTATDYAGLGTPGVSQYLVGQAEAYDVLNSVRAARNLPNVGAGTTLGLWGHSQGGASVLWTVALAGNYAPELHVVAAAVAAPASELSILLSHQWNTPVGSLIGSEVMVAWPATYPNLQLSAITNDSSAQIAAMANTCVAPELIDLTVASKFGAKPLMKVNPLSSQPWADAFAANSPPPPSVPTLVIQGTKDPIVLPGSNVTYLSVSCAAGSNMTGDFIGDLGHAKAGATGAPFVFTWLQQRFAGVPATSTCGTMTTLPGLQILNP